VVVADVQSTHSPRPNPRMPDQVEHRVAAGHVVELLVVLKEGLCFVGGDLSVLTSSIWPFVESVSFSWTPLGAALIRSHKTRNVGWSHLVLQRNVVHVL
jgi:hypothetical protein